MPTPASEVLAAMITPAVLISASGMLTLSTTNRIGRVVDRVRELAEMAEHLAESPSLPTDEVEEKRALITNQLVSLVRRLRLLQTSLTLIYTAVGLLVGTSLSVGILAATQLYSEWVSIVLGLTGALALFLSSMILVVETRVAVRATLEEMAYARMMVSRRTGRIIR